jgi:hypothetical protein
MNSQLDTHSIERLLLWESVFKLIMNTFPFNQKDVCKKINVY